MAASARQSLQPRPQQNNSFGTVQTKALAVRRGLFLQCDSLFDERILQLQTVLKRKCHMTFTEVWTRAEAKIEPVLRHVQP